MPARLRNRLYYFPRVMMDDATPEQQKRVGESMLASSNRNASVARQREKHIRVLDRSNIAERINGRPHAMRWNGSWQSEWIPGGVVFTCPNARVESGEKTKLLVDKHRA